MLEVLYFSDKNVRQQLFEAVDRSEGWLVVSATRHGKFMKPVAEREPYASLEREVGDVVNQLVVADEGSVEGMWRDPVGDLADALFPDDRNEAYASASGYLVLRDGEVATIVKKHGSVKDDGWFLRSALARLDAGIPAPDPSRRPGPRKRRTARPVDIPIADEPLEDTAPQRAPALSSDPWHMLGITPDTPLSEARKAFRALVSQYHPDKVAHLAPEFRELAEERTRQIMAAWEAISRPRD